MIQLVKLAYRDLMRNRRRSVLSSLALGMGVALLILIATVLSGEIRNALTASINLNSGHLQVRAKTYNEDRTSLAWEDLVENPDALAAQIGGLAPVKVATPRLYISGLVTAGEDSLGVRVMGVEPDSPANQPFTDGVIGGQFITADDREGVMLGKPLAAKLGLKAGDPVRILVNTADGTVDEQTFTVRGIYSTRTPSYDETIILMPLAKAQTIARAENHASTIFVLLKDSAQTDAVAAALKTSAYEVKDWREMNALLVETEKFSTAYLMILYAIVLGITATVIVNTLVMSVFERTREIGILSAIGMKSRSIMAMFFIESGLLGVGGIVIGIILGVLMGLYAQNVGFGLGDFGISNDILLGERLYGYLTATDVINLSTISFIVTLLAGVYPALLAARMDPVQALHGGK